ncbi:MAG: spore germination protein GerW family protein [Chloroflexota bacterium]
MTEQQGPMGGEQDSGVELAREVSKMMDGLMQASNVNAAFGEPRQVGDRTIIPVARVGAGGGFGLGAGQGEVVGGRAAGGTGAGGGGGSMANPVAVVVVTTEDVRVQPVVDATQIALAAMAAFAFNFYWIIRLLRNIRTAEKAEEMEKELSLGGIRKMLRLR